MIGCKTLNVAVVPELQSLIGYVSDPGRYGDVSEVVRAASRLVNERETVYFTYVAARDKSSFIDDH